MLIFTVHSLLTLDKVLFSFYIHFKGQGVMCRQFRSFRTITNSFNFWYVFGEEKRVWQPCW
jgi:hypothetical protein